MTFLDQLERRFGRLAFPGLTRGLVFLNALVFLLVQFNPGFLELLTLAPGKVLSGEVWRLVSYLFIPRTLSWLWILFALMFLWYVGDRLEQAWGAFRLNLFYLLGMFGTTLATFLFGGDGTGFYLNLSLFFAFAMLYPEEVILLIVLPVKVKWVAVFSAAVLGLEFLLGDLPTKAAIAVSFLNFLLFFGPGFARALRQRGEVAVRRQRFEASAAPAEEPLHRCAICGKNDQSNPDLDFRVGPDGADYCPEHLPPQSP